MIVGILSPLSWYRSELAGRGDLRLYVLVQFLPLLLTPLILVLWRSPAGEKRHFGAAVARYALAKIAEGLDSEVYQLTGVISGHTLKHLLAALGLAWLAFGAASCARSGPPRRQRVDGWRGVAFVREYDWRRKQCRCLSNSCAREQGRGKPAARLPGRDCEFFI